MTVVITPQPSFDAELDRLRDLLPILGDLTERSLASVRKFFSDQQKDVDPVLAPHLFRYWVKQGLIEHGYTVAIDAEDVPNNGLSILFDSGRIRFWKGDERAVPLPGTSRKKLSFLNQQIEFGWTEAGDVIVLRPNLMLLWSVDQDYNFRSLWLGLPESASRRPQRTVAKWLEEIPYASLLQIADVQPAADDDDDDLPITLNDAVADDELFAQ